MTFGSLALSLCLVTPLYPVNLAAFDAISNQIALSTVALDAISNQIALSTVALDAVSSHLVATPGICVWVL